MHRRFGKQIQANRAEWHRPFLQAIPTWAEGFTGVCVVGSICYLILAVGGSVSVTDWQAASPRVRATGPSAACAPTSSRPCSGRAAQCPLATASYLAQGAAPRSQQEQSLLLDCGAMDSQQARGEDLEMPLATSREEESTMRSAP